MASEYSYGQCLTTEVVEHLGGLQNLSAAPLVPSLQHEADLGFDVAIETSWLLVCLQFKVPQRLVGSNAGQAAEFGVPYFRFAAKTDLTSNGLCQHNVLCDLQQSLFSSGGYVYYAAPVFDSSLDLTHHTVNGSLIDASVFVPPMLLGPVAPNDSHCFAYTTPLNVRAYSEPGPQTDTSFVRVLELLQTGDLAPSTLQVFLERIYEQLRSFAEIDLPENVPAARRVALAAAALGIQPVVVGQAAGPSSESSKPAT